jgi:hypothetical protein
LSVLYTVVVFLFSTILFIVINVHRYFWGVVLILTGLPVSCINNNTPLLPNKQNATDLIIREAKLTIRSGDVIFRSGRDFTSYRIRELSENDNTYSHAGIARVIDTTVLVYHIVPPDIDEQKADSVIRLESLELFVQPAKNAGFGIGRYNITRDEAVKMITYLDSLKKQQVSFDYLFDLNTTDKIYCSEMVDNALRMATGNRIMAQRKKMDPQKAKKIALYLKAPVVEVMKREYIPIDNLYNNIHCKRVGNYVFVPQ